MERIFFDTGYTSVEDALLKVIAFLVVSGLILYLIYLVLTKTLFRKSKHRKEINIRIAFLWSLFAYFIVFNIYIYILLYRNGLDSLHWTKAVFYVGILAQLIIYIGIIAWFFIKRHSLKKIINEISIN